MENFTWTIKAFDELSTKELYSILKARIDVFVVEQNCPYPDVDGYDPQAIHLWAESKGEVVAYCRIFEPGIKHPETSIGRVLTNQKYRKMNLGRTLMRFAINTIEARYPKSSIRISAQDYLLTFYKELGFFSTGKNYLEDDIPHSEMLKT
ncbi:GNAT family N-acetyltransferase [Kaistella flava (ex Peng et al. 2021)]|uniref:GNAT family N-acetyltransferase n=1 Tax=Kaistella flava (ex Peng et al. 2021) TaxID=2038776 RepID=A0A7M2YAN0_9FLAO|nr:GNAT family N-acetyltransferase [Kaistella flava (ex Peng et al. 2021)]QOW11170.1 GNAT family N-acetyltransferase [Kaistella flava (ex Peng et al. 2021)]